VHADFYFNQPNAAARARDWVHSAASCGNSFCTIQSYNGDRYRAYKLTGCTVYDLDNFFGTYDSHNHGTLDVKFRDDSYDVLATYWGGRADAVDWKPVGKIELGA
jgi:hypothetical protein